MCARGGQLEPMYGALTKIVSAPYFDPTILMPALIPTGFVPGPRAGCPRACRRSASKENSEISSEFGFPYPAKGET